MDSRNVWEGRRWIYVSLISLMALLPLGCAANMQDRYKHDRPISNVTTTTKSELSILPKPAQKIPVSVWKILDETGQFRRSAGGGTELSHAVTQGAHHMLIKALNDSGWFTVVEREGWPNLIQEIRIKEELRKRGVTRVPEDFKLLEVPKYMFSGAITEFDDHPVSLGGGFGLRGGSASARAMTSSVAIDLRMTDVDTGVIQEAVSIFKRVIAHQTNFGIFRFIRINWLLELEFGYTLNEPTDLAVREALEKGVVHLIVRGVREGLPEFKPAKAEDMKFFTEYKLETEAMEREKMEQMEKMMQKAEGLKELEQKAQVGETL
jgi:curli production assembly/transport component CsgG